MTTNAPPAPVAKHMHLACADHARSLAFFEQYFGFRLERTIARGDAKVTTVICNPGGFQIALESDMQGAPWPRWFHVGFLLPSAEACRALHDRMTAGGMRIVEPLKENGELVTFMCADPDGHELQVYATRSGVQDPEPAESRSSDLQEQG